MAGARRPGSIQRAELLEAVLADIYGPAKLVREGRLPAAVVAGNPEFLRPLVGVAPPGGAHLRFYARRCRPLAGRALVGARRPHAGAVGRRLRAGEPARAVARHARHLSRSCASSASRRSSRRSRPSCRRSTASDDSPRLRADARAAERDLFRARLSGALSRLPAGRGRGPDRARRRRVHPHRVRPASAPRCCCAGSTPISPIRWSSTPRSRLGVPGLVQAVRDGKVVIANALGAGVVEARAMLELPAGAGAGACSAATCALPNVATWWLGDPARARRRHERLDELVIAPAFSGDMPPHIDRRGRARQGPRCRRARAASSRRSAAAASTSSRRRR